MVFHSIEFAIFLPIVFTLYWVLFKNNLIAQNVLLLVSGYIFYGWWDWRFLSLLITLSATNYLVGIWIGNSETETKRKHWLILGLIVNLTTLGVFKYFNFFIDSFINFASSFGYELSRGSTRIVLPVGISFYIFLALSYLIDVYKKSITAHRNIVNVLVSLSFFPIILAGPIQRPASMLQQIANSRNFSYSSAVTGLKQILWGLFAKVVIADNLAVYVDDFFTNYLDYSGSTLLLGSLFYTVQIYADFSGYSNMAIGIAKLFGFDLMINFAYPYFSRDLIEFWKRWHISLVTWFRDYVFLPISFTILNRTKGETVFFLRTDIYIYIISSIIVWVLTGLWHGANFTFVFWGLLHGLILIGYHLQRNPRKKVLKKLGIHNDNFVIVFVDTSITLVIVTFAWILFRAENIDHALMYLSGIFSRSLFCFPEFPEMRRALVICLFVIGFFILEWKGRTKPFPIINIGANRKRWIRFAFYYLLLSIIFLYGGKEQNFIYFQF